ncbi:4095_t:CDS:2, partial [Diversispora eburnea]
IIVHASPEATNDFAQSCLAIESMTRDIYTPEVGEVLNVSAAINFYQVKLTDALVSSLKFSKLDDYNIAFINGKILFPPDYSLPILDVVQTDELNSSNHNPVFVGEVKLTELKRVLQSEGIVAEFKGEGILVCNEKVAVRKTSTGQLILEGFGSYRINLKEISYQNALEHAIKSGINVIDTSANFELGESEEVIGSVLENMFKKELVSREDLVVISKAGYFETSNIESLDNSFAKVSNNSAHSIAPEFLMGQINQSLKRLKLNKLDIFMLNNPERMMQAKNKLYSINNLYNDIKHAFHYLDSEVTRGRIKGYGICSNTMAKPDAIDHISLSTILERLPESSKQNFFAIQVPFNLFERDTIMEFQEYSLAQYAKVTYEQITNDLADEFQKLTQLETELNESLQKITNLIISYAYFNLLSMNNDLDSILSTISPSLLLDDDDESQLHNSSLSVKALRILLANSSVGCILVGMRNINYVNDSILALNLSDDDFLTVESLKDIYNCSLLQ